MKSYNWVSKDSDLSNAIAGGMAGNGEPFYVCRAKHIADGRTIEIPGKLYLKFDCCYIGFNEKEYCYNDFLVLTTT